VVITHIRYDMYIIIRMIKTHSDGLYVAYRYNIDIR
jgi:hypothetical protein